MTDADLKAEIAVFAHELCHVMGNAVGGAVTSTITREDDGSYTTVGEWTGKASDGEGLMLGFVAGQLYGANKGVDTSHDDAILGCLPKQTYDALLARAKAEVAPLLNNLTAAEVARMFTTLWRYGGITIGRTTLQ